MSKTVLIVDDEPDIQDILSSYLKRIDGMEVVNALSGEEGVERYKELLGKNQRLVLVVMDLNLSGTAASGTAVDLHRQGRQGGMDGVRTAEEILRLDPRVVIWGYTAWADTTWAAKLTEAGAEKVVDRVVPFKEFARMVGAFVTD